MGLGEGELGPICISRKCTLHFKENHQRLYNLGIQERRKDFEEPQSLGARDIRRFNTFSWLRRVGQHPPPESLRKGTSGRVKLGLPGHYRLVQSLGEEFLGTEKELAFLVHRAPKSTGLVKHRGAT